jgi:glycosyltransferase involved in cell wall biosynthesis
VCILIISAVFPPEPVVSAKLSFDLATELSRNHEVVVLSPKPSRPFGFNFKDHNTEFIFKHILLNSFTCPQFSIWGRLRESFSFGLHCYKYILKNSSQISLIYFNTWPLFGQFFVVKAAKKSNIPIVIHIQDIYPESLINSLPLGGFFLIPLLRPIDRYNLSNCLKIIAISEKMKSYLTKTRHIKDDKILVVQNWQDEKEFVQDEIKNRDSDNTDLPFTFMYLGNIGPLAGVENLIEAFLLTDLTKCRLVLAGSGSMKESLVKKSKKSNTNTIEFWDVPAGKVPEVQRSADVFLLPLKKGGSSNSVPSKLMSYMYSKKPVIAAVETDSETANSIALADCGWIVPPENIKLLSSAMIKAYLTSKVDLEKKGYNGQIFASHNFSKKINLQKISELLISMI